MRKDIRHLVRGIEKANNRFLCLTAGGEAILVSDFVGFG